MQTEEVVLVYLIKEEIESEEVIPTKFGGAPVWMYNHKITAFECPVCKQTLTFLCQLFAPLNTEETFNRAFYVFFCESDKCQNNKKAFQVYRMQAPSSVQISPHCDDPPKFKTLKEQYYVEVDTVDRSEIKAIGEKVIKELNEIDQDDQDSDFEEEKSNIKMEYVNADEDLQGIQELTETKKVDPVFQTYTGTISKLGYPVILYGTHPLQFKDQHINVSQKRCTHCKSPMRFQFQINSSLLASFQKLLKYDWGTVRVYTCEKSCGGQKEGVFREDVELQIEEDTATNREEIEKQLAEIQRENKKKEMKKEKRKQKKMEKKEKKEKEQGDKGRGNQEDDWEDDEGEGEGDWD